MLALLLALVAVSDSTDTKPHCRHNLIGVTVTPDGSWDSERAPNTSGYSVVFHVTNLQNSTISYTLTRSDSGHVTSTSQSDAQVTLAKNAFKDVTEIGRAHV